MQPCRKDTPIRQAHPPPRPRSPNWGRPRGAGSTTGPTGRSRSSSSASTARRARRIGRFAGRSRVGSRATRPARCPSTACPSWPPPGGSTCARGRRRPDPGRGSALCHDDGPRRRVAAQVRPIAPGRQGGRHPARSRRRGRGVPQPVDRPHRWPDSPTRGQGRPPGGPLADRCPHSRRGTTSNSGWLMESPKRGGPSNAATSWRTPQTPPSRRPSSQSCQPLARGTCRSSNGSRIPRPVRYELTARPASIDPGMIPEPAAGPG